MFNMAQRFAVLFILFFAIFKSSWSLSGGGQPSIMGKVTDGANAGVNSAPFIVSFQFRNQHFCAGSIIKENWILTAAHCLTKKEEVIKNTVLLAGSYNLKDKAASAQTRSIDRRIINELYTGDTSPYDVGLVYTKTPFKWSAAVKAIALPSGDYTSSGNAILFGWGSISKTEKEIFPSLLQVATVPIITLKSCESAMGPKSVYVHETNLCTGPLKGTIGICTADSGGPLIQNIGGKAVLVGVASWGKTPCGQPPSVFVKVSSLLSWIQKRIN